MGRRFSDDASAFTRLLEVIESAAQLVEDLRNAPLFQRLLTAFRLMPIQDRETVVGAIEREVKARRLSCAIEEVTGQSMHANPHARLYLRAHESPVSRNFVERDEMMFAMLSAFRVTPILTTPEIHDSWIEGTREAITHLDVGTRAVVEGLLREALALVVAEEGRVPAGGARGASDGKVAV
jgi:hypothetical protein